MPLLPGEVRARGGERGPEVARRIGMTRAVSASAVSAGLVAVALTSCSPSASRSESASGFSSQVGVLGCADFVVWGTVESVEPVADALEVTFDVEEWVSPSAGTSSVMFLADDPVKEVGAPAWEPSVEKVLVVASKDPTQRYPLAYGQSAVSQWREAGSPIWPQERCDGA